MVHVAFTSLVVGVATVLAPAQPAGAAV